MAEADDLRREVTYLREEIASLREHLADYEKIRDDRAKYKALAQAVFDVSTDGIVLLDSAGTIQAVNSVVAMRMKREPSELIGTSMRDHCPQELAETRHYWLSQAADTLKPVRFKDEQDGIVYGHRLFPYRDTRTNTVRVAVFSRDITPNERALEAIRQSDARYRAIVEDQTELICRYLPDGRLTFVNQAYARYNNRRPDELVGTNFIPHIPEEDLRRIRQAVDSLTPVSPSATFEHRVIREDGDVHWQQWTHRAILDEEGHITEYQAVGRDISRQVQAQRALNENRAFLRLIIDTVPNPIFVKNRDGFFVLVNQAMADLYGTTAHELVGKRGSDFNPNEDEITIFRAEDEEVLDSRSSIFIPQRVVTDAKGERRWLATTKLPLPGKDQLLGVAVDITERKEAEAERTRLELQVRQAQKMQALGTLAGGIAHDFNNMLFAILGFVRLAQRKVEKLPKDIKGIEKLEENLSNISSAGLRASDLVRQILTFSRRTDSEMKPVRIATLFKEISKMLRATVPSSVELETDFQAKDDLVIGDPTQLHQVLMNLCVNASHAMRSSGGTLTLSLSEKEVNIVNHPERLPGTYLVIGVQDTGEGIPAGILDQIFDPFFTTKPPGEGTGMGLSVVHGIIINHGGFIDVTSRKGEGSLFEVYLPHPSEKSCDDAPTVRPITPGTERILFVDDEPMITQMVQEVLSGLGYRVTAVSAPADALELLSQSPETFDLLITDQSMPGMNGTELSQKTRQIRPDMPILLLTGYSESVTPENAEEFGIDAVIMKPVVEAKLSEAVRELLDSPREGRNL